MATNKYFNLYHQKTEQNLIQSLVEETVKIHGIDAVYIPRDEKKVDDIFREDVLSSFNDYYFIEVYVKNIDAFDGDQDIFKKFGLEINNQITFSISRSSFNKIAGKQFIRPREGDLVYLPMSTATGLYEIKFVKEDSVFFNLGEFYIYDLQCELFVASNEDVNTGIQEVDQQGSEQEILTTINLSGGTGSFEIGEVAYQGESIIGADAKGVVVSIEGNSLRLKDVYGTFLLDFGPVKGKNAQYGLADDSDNTTQSTFSEQNDNFDEFSVIDFTEHNPFSEEDF